ncbi:MAG: hypothetical protein HQK60_17125 [Deltaproteobacteria bacterium]|nr:hypothetical protein [Deltaproteobacteria bacterium]
MVQLWTLTGGEFLIVRLRRNLMDNICEGAFTIAPDKIITTFNRVAEEIAGIPHADQEPFRR